MQVMQVILGHHQTYQIYLEPDTQRTLYIYLRQGDAPTHR